MLMVMRYRQTPIGRSAPFQKEICCTRCTWRACCLASHNEGDLKSKGHATGPHPFPCECVFPGIELACKLTRAGTRKGCEMSSLSATLAKTARGTFSSPRTQKQTLPLTVPAVPRERWFICCVRGPTMFVGCIDMGWSMVGVITAP